MSRESAALNVDSVQALPNGMVLNELESSGASSSSLAVNLADNASAMPVAAYSKETMPIAGLGYNSQPVIVNMNAASESQEQLFNSGVAYLKRCNGVSGSPSDQRHVDSLKRLVVNRNQMNHGWPTQNGQLDGRGQGHAVGRMGRSAEPRTNANVAHPSRNDMKWMVSSSDKRINSHDAQRQNLGEKKSVKILQRPSSVTKILGHDVADPGNHERDVSAATHQKKGRKKTLSLNPDELEDLEILIEQVLKDGIEETNTDSDDDDDDDDDEVIETVIGKGNSNEGRKTSPEKLAASRNFDKAEREAKMEMAKHTVIRNETGAKGRKFVKETGKNMGRGRDQGRRRENPKAKDNHRSGNFQSRRVNEVSPPTPTLMEDDKAKQNMTNVYPAQLKVALKHMDSLPPRFQRRLQTGMSEISGSDPTLSKLMEAMSPPTESRGSSSSFGCRDGEKSREVRERGSRKSIRNLLALYDEEAAMPASVSFPRRLSYSSGAISEPGNPTFLNALHDASLQVSNPNANGLPSGCDAGKPMSMSDPFRSRPPPIFQQRRADKMFMMNGSYIADPLGTDPSINFGREFAQWHLDRSAAASPLPGPRKTAFSVNAPEFVSTLFPSSNPAMNGDSTGGHHHMISGSLDGVASLGFANDANQMMANQSLSSSNMIDYRNSIAQQPEYANVSIAGQQPGHFPMVPGMPVTTGRNMALDPSFGPMVPPGANFPPRQRLVGMNMVPYTSVPMPYEMSGRGYVPQQQVLMPPMSNQQYVGAGNMQMTDQQMNTVAGDLAPMQWYAGGTQGSFMGGSLSNQLLDGVPFGGRVGPDGGWPAKAFVQPPLPFEVGRQRTMRLMSEGNFVMVILVGRMDSAKLSAFSELQSNATGSFVLNLRNGICPSSEEKILELHQWNYKQAMEAVEAQKNPVIIDHPFAQQWQLRDFVGLAHMNNYFVEMVDCDDGNQFRGFSNMSSYIWNDWRPNVQQQLLAADESATSVGLNRYNIPSVMNGVYYLPSASTPSSLASQQQQQQQQQQQPPVAHGDQMACSIQNVLLPASNVSKFA